MRRCWPRRSPTRRRGSISRWSIPGVGIDAAGGGGRGSREGDRVLVGPDNGLLSLAIERLGGADEAVDVSASPVRLEPLSATFHGRDLFAPVAAHLALGAPLTELGEPIDPPASPGSSDPAAVIEPDVGLTATVSHLDGYGNARLIATAEDAAAAGLEHGERDRASGPAMPSTRASTGAPSSTSIPASCCSTADSSGRARAGGQPRRRRATLLGVAAGDEVELVRA